MRPVAIVGVGESRVGRLRGMSALRLTLEAARAAIQDAGVTAAAIDGVLTRNFDMDVTYMHSQLVAQHLGLKPRFTTDINLGGATAIAMLEQAALLIATGVCRLVLCAYGENRRTSWAVPRHGRIKMGNEDFEECYGLTWGMGPHALAAQRHMHVFGTTSRQLGMIAVAQRRYAMQNPNADLRTPLTLEEYENAPLLIAPLRKYDLAYLFDGGAAVVVAGLPWARDHPARPVPILGLGQAHSGDHIAYCASMVTSTTTPARRSGEEAFRAAGVGPQDIDVALLYDDTTYGVLVQLEDYGFCPKGARRGLCRIRSPWPSGCAASQPAWWEFIPGPSRWHVAHCGSRAPITWRRWAAPGARRCCRFGKRFWRCVCGQCDSHPWHH